MPTKAAIHAQYGLFFTYGYLSNVMFGRASDYSLKYLQLEI